MDRVLQVLGPWHKPADLPAWTALAFAAYLAFRALFPWTMRASRPLRFLTTVGFAAAFLSLGYIAHYLRGGPRIIDATAYFLQGRGLSHGLLSWPIPEVSASFRGRFLLFQEPDRVAGIFPPGYPLLLSLGFLVGAPMVVGPLLGAGIAIATYALAREMIDPRHPDRETAARLAAVLSVVCAALRYHTADTMAHGACALAITLALASAFAALRNRAKTRAYFAIAGLLVGYVACTRMASAVAIGVAVLVLAWAVQNPPTRAPGTTRSYRIVAWTLLATLPGVLFLLAANRAATGHAFRAAQAAYYAASDGPPGCFRYGFGRGIGCLFEHGDFVRAHLENGYGILAALGTTVRRLRMHLTDIANFEPLAFLVFVPLSRSARFLRAVIAGHILAYAPFYFDGNYPGGGARFYADILPLEHVLLALAMLRLLPRVAFVRRAFGLLALTAFGFAVHASHEHLALATRDGGRPMFEPDKLREANLTHGLVFFDSDHGYNLAHDPGVLASHGILAARLRGDDHDRLLDARLGHPNTHVYKLGPDGPEVERFQHGGQLTDPTWKFESESDWPPLRQSGGWAEPSWKSTSCASGGRVLTLHATPGQKAQAVIELPVPRASTWKIRPSVFADAASLRAGSAESDAEIVVYHAKDQPLATWKWRPTRLAAIGTAEQTRPICEVLATQTAELNPPRAFVSLVTNAEISIDYINIEGLETSH